MKNINKKTLIRLIVCVVVIAAAIPIAYAAGVFKGSLFKNIRFNGKVLVNLLVMIASVLAIEAIASIVLGLLKPKSHRARSIISIISSLLKYVAVIVILCWGLTIIGVNVSTIVVSVGIVALVVGFSAESLIADVVTGAFMIFENQYNVGDIVEVDGFRGTVSSIGIRTTFITDPGDNVKIVNNSAMKNILNRSDKLSRSVCNISIPYGTDIEKLEEQIPGMMRAIYENHTNVMKSDPVYLGVQELADSSIVLRFVVNVDEKDIYSGARILNHDILLAFRHAGVECPFPQLDVHSN